MLKLPLKLKWMRKEAGWYLSHPPDGPTIEQSGLRPGVAWEVFVPHTLKPIAAVRTLREAKRIAQAQWAERQKRVRLDKSVPS